jgi:ABC-2 type transport system permease protein
MKGAWVIAGKDLRNIFLSPLFWVISGLCCTAWTFVYFMSVQDFASQSMMQMRSSGVAETGGPSLHFVVFAKHVSVVNLFLIFAVSALSIRLFAEEKRTRSIDLLLTSPVTATEIVLGKLVAGIGMAWALVLISALYPISLAFFAQIELGILISSYLGLMLLVACYVAIGMFCSSLTESAVVSVVMSLIFCVLLWFLGMLSESAPGSTFGPVFEYINVGTHFVGFLKGSVSIASTIFFLSIIFLYSFLTQRVIESTRWR